MMKKIDKILAAGLLLTAVLLGIFLFAGKEEGTWAVVTIDGTEYGSYALDKEQTIDLGTGNHLEIRGGDSYDGGRLPGSDLRADRQYLQRA